MSLLGRVTNYRPYITRGNKTLVFDISRRLRQRSIRRSGAAALRTRKARSCRAAGKAGGPSFVFFCPNVAKRTDPPTSSPQLLGLISKPNSRPGHIDLG